MVCGVHGVTIHHALQHVEMVSKQDIANARARNLMEWTARQTQGDIEAHRRLVVTLRIAQV